MWHKRLVSATNTVFSFEMLFILFLFAGVFKSDPRFAWIPMDLTLLMMALTILLGSWIMLKSKLYVERTAIVFGIAYLAFAIFAIVSLLWTPGVTYATDKAIKMLTLVGWSTIGSAWIIAQDPVRVARFQIAMMLFAVWIAFEGVLVYMQNGNGGFVNVMGGTYLGAGQIIGLGAIVSLCYGLLNKGPIGWNLVAFLILGLCLFQLLVGGGRGPFLAFIVSCVMLIPYMLDVRRNRLYIHRFTLVLVIFMSVLALSAWAWSQSGSPPQTLSRLELLMPGSDGIGSSAATRVNNADDAIELWMNHPFIGNGVGSWPILTKMDDFRDYPHNLFVEVLVELGVAGIMLLMILLSFVIRSIVLIYKKPLSRMMIVLIMMAIYMLFNVLVSGDIPDNRVFFAAMGLLMAVYSRERKGGAAILLNAETDGVHK
ncbi:O-antigen ligase family protein [Paenibacillus terrigena]|uniref:O-antigen ligase family protein n=1 Tax=Paenibacillus terrigena TaxID=369333 RepID=UPI0028D143F3|nr:O-antigen ligase family protein [Paenibacillus terrigena]